MLQGQRLVEIVPQIFGQPFKSLRNRLLLFRKLQEMQQFITENAVLLPDDLRRFPGKHLDLFQQQFKPEAVDRSNPVDFRQPGAEEEMVHELTVNGE